MRFRRELSAYTTAEREQLGFEMLPLPHLPVAGQLVQPLVPMPRVCTLKIFKLAPESRLARDLEQLGDGSSFTALRKELVLQIFFGSDFPFESPSVRVVFPILTPVPLVGVAESGERLVSLDMCLQARGKSVALQGERCSNWAVSMGQSCPRFAGWLRNWIVGSGARVDLELSQHLSRQTDSRAAAGHWRLRTIGGLWVELKLLVAEGHADVDFVSLPSSLRAAVEREERGHMEVCHDQTPVESERSTEEAVDVEMEEEEEEEEVEEEEPGVAELKQEGEWVIEPVSFIEISTRGSWNEGGGRMVVRAVTSWESETSIVVSPRVASALGIAPSTSGEMVVEVRGVEVREAARVECKAPAGASANTVRYNLPSITASLVASKAICCSHQTLAVTLDGERELELCIVRVIPFDHTCFSANTVLSLVS